jgi:hypothetical protein
MKIREATPRSLFNLRAWNIAMRTAHLAAMGILLGGHAFDVAPPQLVGALWFTVVTGIILGALEAGPRLVWFHQGRGLMTMAKLLLVACVPVFWAYRLPILLVVVALGSVGSHMPARFRYYSVLYNEVVPDRCGPGGSQLAEKEDRSAETPGRPERSESPDSSRQTV